MKFFAKANNKSYELELDNSTEPISVHVNGRLIKADLVLISKEDFYSLLVDNRSYQLFIKKDSQGYDVAIGGQRFFVELQDEKTRQPRNLLKADEKPKGQIEIKAPMPGLIVKIEVEEGQKINKGDGLVIIEAMKMENEVRANVGGIIKQIFKKEEETVEKDMVLMIIE